MGGQTHQPQSQGVRPSLLHRSKIFRRSRNGLTPPTQTSPYTEPNQLSTEADAKRQWIHTSPYSPRNWPPRRKWNIVLGLNYYTLVIFVASTGFVTDQVQQQFGVGTEVSILGQSIFILGIAVGVCSRTNPRISLPL